MGRLSNPGTGLGGGRKIVSSAGVAEQMAEPGRHVGPKCAAVAITAESDNTGLIGVGGSDVVVAAGEQTNALALLNAGDTLTLEIADPSLLFVDATVDGEGVSYGFITT